MKFASRDAWAGGTNLNAGSDYVKWKKISIEGPFDEPELVQLSMHACYELESNRAGTADVLLPCWEKDSPKAMAAARKLCESGAIRRFARENTGFSRVYDYILELVM